MLLDRHALALAALLLSMPLRVSAQEPRANVGVGAVIDQRELPLTLEADELRGRPDLDLVAEGKVLLQRGRLTLSSDRLEYDNIADRASARGNVRIETADGDWFAGPELSLTLGRYEGWFTKPEYFFARTRAGGRADGGGGIHQRYGYVAADNAFVRIGCVHEVGHRFAGVADE